MDHSRFDDLTRALATTHSRRQFLKTFAAGAAGGLLAALGGGQAAAKPCKKLGKRCSTYLDCCSGVCHHNTCTSCLTAGTEIPADEPASNCCSNVAFCTTEEDGVYRCRCTEPSP